VENTQTAGEHGTRLFVSAAPPTALPQAWTDETSDEPWWATPYGSWRLSAEVKAMRERFPSFRIVAGDDGALVWSGRVRSSLTRKRYRIKVAYPSTFPDHPPIVTIEGKKFPPGTPHLLDGGRPCLYWPSQGSSHGYDPGRTTAATLVAWTALWLHAYETWRATGTWPGRAE
jgi:hypothetical protein